MLEILSYSFSTSEVLVIVLAAILIGMAKTGVHGSGMIAVPMIAIIFGGKDSTGFILPILIFADIFAVRKYHQHADWYQLRRLLPYAVLGIIIGTLIGDVIDDDAFTQIMAFIIFSCVALMVWRELQTDPVIPSSAWFVSSIGIIGGFATMVGNLAGPVMGLFLLAMRFPKNAFLGTAAWFFLSVNVIKVPLHIFIWETISIDSFLINLMLIPAIGLGAYLGIRLIKLVPEKPFRWFIIGMTFIAALAMVI
ncbi:MAG: putative membrane protein YfcA [Cryomorphaceae bacterium]|jgi:uncharacterized membrane protein YfcA